MENENTPETPTRMFIAKNSISLIRDGISALRDLMLVLLVVLVFSCPDFLKKRLISLGYEQIETPLGVVNLLKADDDAKATALKLGEAQSGNTAVAKALDTLAAQETDPKRKAQIIAVSKKVDSIRADLIVAKGIAKKKINEHAEEIEKVQEALDVGGGWGVVYSGEPTLKSAQYEVTVVAKKFNVPNAKLYYRQGSYRAVSVLKDRKDAGAVLERIKLRRKDAYIVSMDTWCPDMKEDGEYCTCGK